jgi:cystathionine beta-lyase/cystathionine gamma-synthase
LITWISCSATTACMAGSSTAAWVLARQAVSLGGVDTLIVHAAAMWAGTLSDEALQATGIEPSLVRLSIGLEHPDDLIADLRRGLDVV